MTAVRVSQLFSSTDEYVDERPQQLLLYPRRRRVPGIGLFARWKADVREYPSYVTLATVSNSTPRGIATVVAAGLTAIQAARCGVTGAALPIVRAASRTSITQDAMQLQLGLVGTQLLNKNVLACVCLFLDVTNRNEAELKTESHGHLLPQSNGRFSVTTSTATSSAP